MLDLAAIAVVINEDILYEVHYKVFKVLFILFVPVIGAIVELQLLSRYAHSKNESAKGDDTQWYAFEDHYSSDSSSGGLGSDSGGGSSGSGD